MVEEKRRARREHEVRRRRRRRTAILASAGAIAVGLIGAGVALAAQANAVVAELTSAKERLHDASDLLVAGDTDGLRSAADEVMTRTAHADDIVSGWLWGAATRLPAVGDDAAAVRTATQAVHETLTAALPAAVGALDGLAGAPAAGEGGLDLTPLRACADALDVVDGALSRGGERLAGIDRAGLIGPVDRAIAQAEGALGSAAPAVAGARADLPVVLALAGSDGPRRYLVVFQNNAEIRATGGNPSAMAVVGVDDGRIELAEQAAGADFYAAGTAGVAHGALDDGAVALYEDDTALYVQNYTRTPDFPTTARWLARLWHDTTGSDLDGVVSLDPIGLAAMLSVIGDVPLADGNVLTADGAVDYLLRDVYALTGGDGHAADAVFADVVQRVFARVSEGGWSPIALGEALAAPAAEQRVLAWMPRDDEERLIRSAGLDGGLAASAQAPNEIGVFLNDASHSKLEFYLRTDIDVQCAAGVATTTVTLTSSAPPTGLNGYVIGQRNHLFGVAPTAMLLDVLVFAPGADAPVLVEPAGGDIRGWDRSGVEQGRAARSVAVAVPPGGVRTVTFQVPVSSAGPVTVRHTPGVAETSARIAEECR